MKAAHRLIRLDLWGKNGREGHRAQIELLGDPNQIFAMLSGSRIPIHL